MPKIAIEGSLTNVKDLLENNGYEVVQLEGDNVPACDCCVITGQDENMMGMMDRVTDAIVINAEGLSAEEILSQFQQRTKS